MDNEQLVREIQQGINKIDNLEALFIQNIGIIRLVIYKTLKRSFIPEYILDDFIQIGYLALERASAKFGSSKGISFVTYLVKYVRGYILRFGCPFSGLYDKNISLDTPIKDGDNITIADTLPDDSDILLEEAAERAYLKSNLWKICQKNLNEREYRFIVDKYKENKLYKHIADENNITVSYAQTVTKTAIRKLKNNKDMRKIGQEWGYLYFRNVGVSEFNRTWTSSVEWAVLKGLWNEEKFKKYYEDEIKRGL